MSSQKTGSHKHSEKFSSPIGKELAVLADDHILVTKGTSRHEDLEHLTHENKGAVLEVAKDRPHGKDQEEDSVPHVGTTSIQATPARLTSVTKQEFLSTPATAFGYF